jgi:hypothetical protein
MTSTSVRSRQRSEAEEPAGATWPFRVHLASLLVAFAFLLWVNRHQWFDVDEWAFLVGRGVTGGREHLLEPHNEHWSTLPILLWRALFAVFGVRTYFPYVLSLVTVHLVAVHLLWRVTRRSHVDEWTATLICIPVTIMGVGWENLLLAFQMSFIVPVALGLVALLLLPARGPLGSRDGVVLLLLLIALLWSGAAVTMVVIVALYAWLVRGFGVALALAAPPGMVYLLWLALWGHDVPSGPSEPVSTAVQRLPAMVWRGLVAAVDGYAGLPGIAAVLLAVLSWYVLTRLVPQHRRYALPIAMAAGAPTFLALASVRRSALGVEAAAAPRYSYLVIVFLVPVSGLAWDALLRGRNPALRTGSLAVVTALFLAVQAPLLNDNARQSAAREQEQKHRVMATAALIRDGESFLDPIPVPTYMPDLTVDDIARLDREGQLPGNVRVTEADRLTARAYLQATLTRQRALGRPTGTPVLSGLEGASAVPVPGGNGCIDVTGRAPVPVVTLRWVTPGSISIDSAGGGNLGLRVRDEGSTGRARTFAIAGGEVRYLNVGTDDVLVELMLPAGLTTLCDVAPLDEEFVP